MLYTGRILCGIAAGICIAVIPSYIGYKIMRLSLKLCFNYYKDDKIMYK